MTKLTKKQQAALTVQQREENRKKEYYAVFCINDAPDSTDRIADFYGEGAYAAGMIALKDCPVDFNRIELYDISDDKYRDMLLCEIANIFDTLEFVTQVSR